MRSEIKRTIYHKIFKEDYQAALMAESVGLPTFLQFIFAGNNRYLASDQILEKYKNQYKGQQCVIVGNGPSLNITDMSLLKNKITFGLNRIYLGRDKFDFEPSFLVCVNKLVLEQSWETFKEIKIPKFFSSRYGIRRDPYKNTVFLKPLRNQSERFSRDLISNGVHEGWTVTFVAIQLAYWMGFSKVILVGVDHNFVTKGKANSEIVSEGDDLNHFHTDYFGKGFRWQLPDLVESEKSYHAAKQVFEESGREIVDCTVGGKCEVFRKSTLENELR